MAWTFKNANLMKVKEKLRNYSGLNEPKGTWQLNAICDPRVALGPEKKMTSSTPTFGYKVSTLLGQWMRLDQGQ